MSSRFRRSLFFAITLGSICLILYHWPSSNRIFLDDTTQKPTPGPDKQDPSQETSTSARPKENQDSTKIKKQTPCERTATSLGDVIRQNSDVSSNHYRVFQNYWAFFPHEKFLSTCSKIVFLQKEHVSFGRLLVGLEVFSL
jgi:hypothetical protein